jgi:Fur family peroxide stress response transcriptional regulator
VLKNTKSHPTADWVYDKVKKKIPNMPGTVLQELKHTQEPGRDTELSYGKGFSRLTGTHPTITTSPARTAAKFSMLKRP